MIKSAATMRKYKKLLRQKITNLRNADIGFRDPTPNAMETRALYIAERVLEWVLEDKRLPNFLRTNPLEIVEHQVTHMKREARELEQRGLYSSRKR